jgi:hypothetical protein
VNDLAGILALVLIAVGIVLARLPVEECPYCPHCQRLRREREDERRRIEAERLVREEEQRLLAHRRWHESTGAPTDDCPGCRR